MITAPPERTTATDFDREKHDLYSPAMDRGTYPTWRRDFTDDLPVRPTPQRRFQSRLRAILCLDKLRDYPRHFVAFGSLCILLLIVFLLLASVILGRSVISLDFGVILAIIAVLFWGMAVVSRFDQGSA